MEAFGMALIVVAVFLFALMLGVGFLVGYFVGRSAGRRQAQRGFPVQPVDKAKTPGAKTPGSTPYT